MEEQTRSNFIKDFINIDIKENKNGGKIVTRFPPEPNGYLHIGHAKSIALNFGLAKEFNGVCHLRMDDTNPSKEDVEYIESIQEDIKWLGFDWGTNFFFASDYFETLYGYAIELIKAGKAYVCDLSPEEMRLYRGTLVEAGKESPYRNRTVEENLDLFQKMKNGEFPNGTRVLRAKIDMSSPNLNLRDPIIYRIQHTHHHRTGDSWCIYPMYDFAHPLSDAIEKITHSICTLEFEDHRPLYDWFVNNIETPGDPRQIEFARLNLNYTVMSKRKLLELVQKKYVVGWDDPRMPTISGLRRRGYTPEAIRNFCDAIGVAKSNSTVDVALLEHFVREDLNTKAPRVMAVLNPIKVVIDNYPENQVEYFEGEYHPDFPEIGSREVAFSKEIFIEREDFEENPPKKYFRLAPGQEVRLKYAYYITCTHVVKNDTGEIIEVHCSYDPESKGAKTADGRKVKGTIHWVSASHSKNVEVRLYEHLFTCPNPGEERDYKDDLNPTSLTTISAKIEENLANSTHFQFLRNGYFCIDSKDSTSEKPIFNRVVSLKSSYKPE
ncbi:glutamine--tRNA ligase/YqeY domain fusion protein [bacterium]|nr:glutamine--tRNA ligase/YqeY domain fusion protein [bacterium]